MDKDIIASRLDRTVASNKAQERIKQALKSLPEGISNGNIEREILDLKKQNIGLRLASSLAAGRSGDEVDNLIESYRNIGGITEESTSDYVQSGRLSDLVEKHFNERNLIKLSPDALNAACDGGARPGHHVLVFAPTEMGKTLFVINLVSGFTKQGLRTLYVGNEDPAPDIMMRYITNIVGKDKFTIKRNIEKSQKVCDEANYELLTLVALAPGNFKQIRQLVNKYKPNVVVLDQLRNVDVNSENRTQALEKAATEARNLGKSMGLLVISVAQAGDSASGKRILSRGDVDGSNVGIPGQCDLMIGIGADEDMERMNLRMLSFPKNKLSGNHDPISITIDPTLSRVYDGSSITENA